jgi:glutaminyl-peptide cyclotransferase
MRRMFGLLTFGLAVSVFVGMEPMRAEADGVERLTIRILAEYPHDTNAFTQGLIWCGDYVYESTGRYGASRLRQVRLSDGELIREVRLSPRLFGEGLARRGEQLVQLTWRSGIAMIYDFATFRETGRLSYSGEGWGLTFDGGWFIMSDGSDVLTFRDPDTFAVWRRLPVTLEGRPVHLLNELEYAHGSVFANVWQSTDIVRIDPATGAVTAVIDASSLPYRSRMAGEDVLNGIAYHAERGTFLLTGKLWPKLFEVRFE